MTRTVYWIKPDELSTLDPLVDALKAGGTLHERQLRQVAQLQKRPFSVFIDFLNQVGEVPPTVDAFTFDMDSDELIVFSDAPEMMVEAFIEMAMYMQGFATLMGVEETWKIQVAIGAWRHVRNTIKERLGIGGGGTDKAWAVMLNPEGIEDYTLETFAEMVRLAGSPGVEVLFPPNTSPRISNAYRHLARVISLIAQGIDMSDHVEFNQRLLRALDWIEEKIAPKPE
jgi:hypothetical protein